MNYILHSSTSVVHVLAGLLALVSGTYILFTPKGTTTHRLVGRLYTLSMIILLVTAFQIFTLLGHFSIVHWGAVGSSVALIIGLTAIRLRPLTESWLQWHYFGMGTSVVGLYAAFCVESTYCLFSPTYFWWICLSLATLVFGIGSLLLIWYYTKTSQ